MEGLASGPQGYNPPATTTRPTVVVAIVHCKTRGTPKTIVPDRACCIHFGISVPRL